MEWLLQWLQAHYRNKRIQNIAYLRSQVGLDLEGDILIVEENISPPIWSRFLLQIVILLGLGWLLGSIFRVFTGFSPTQLVIGIAVTLQLVNAWLSVELSDYIWLNHYRNIKTILRAASLVFVGLLIATELIILQGKGAGTVVEKLENWRVEVSQNLQGNSITSTRIIGTAKGKNWALIRNANGQLEALTVAQAKKICGDRLGNGWRLPAPEQLSTLQPYPQLSRSVYIWTINTQEKILLTALPQSLPTGGNAFSSYTPTSLNITLCYGGIDASRPPS